MGFRGHSSWWTEDYLTNKDPQMKALRAMLKRVTESRNSRKWDYMAIAENIYDDAFFEVFFWRPFLDIWTFPEVIGTYTTGIIWYLIWSPLSPLG